MISTLRRRGQKQRLEGTLDNINILISITLLYFDETFTLCKPQEASGIGSPMGFGYWQPHGLQVL